jgi:transposase InsO family protein
MRYTKTNPAIVPIGERRRPDNQGKPGYLRIDSVHQGDFNGVKGVYHINVIDEATQWELVGCVGVISEKFLIPLLEKLLSQFPFRIINFHSDNGSEYINYQVAEMLNKLMIKQTKSRSRKTNDQALVEGKNGSVIRKHMGRNHIPKKYANAVNQFYREYFNVFLNYHRVCGFSADYIDKKGKIKKKYDIYLTPYDRLKSLEEAESYLREDISFEELDKIAYAESDIKFGEKIKKEKDKLFKK